MAVVGVLELGGWDQSQLAVQAPVRWLDRQLKGEGARRTAVGADQALTGVEDLTVRVALVGLVAAGAAMISALAEAGASTTERMVGGAVVAAAGVLTAYLVVRRRNDRIPPDWPAPPPE